MFHKCLTPKFVTIRSYMQQKEPQTSTIQFKQVLATLTASDTCVFTVAPSAPSTSVPFRRIPTLPMHATAPDTSLRLCRFCRFCLCRLRFYHCHLYCFCRPHLHLRCSTFAASTSDAYFRFRWKTTCGQLVRDMDLLSDRTVSAVSYKYPDVDR
jgi:hypothetical protein